MSSKDLTVRDDMRLYIRQIDFEDLVWWSAFKTNYPGLKGIPLDEFAKHCEVGLSGQFKARHDDVELYVTNRKVGIHGYVKVPLTVKDKAKIQKLAINKAFHDFQWLMHHCDSVNENGIVVNNYEKLTFEWAKRTNVIVSIYKSPHAVGCKYFFGVDYNYRLGGGGGGIRLLPAESGVHTFDMAVFLGLVEGYRMFGKNSGVSLKKLERAMIDQRNKILGEPMPEYYADTFNNLPDFLY